MASFLRFTSRYARAAASLGAAAGAAGVATVYAERKRASPCMPPPAAPPATQEYLKETETGFEYCSVSGLVTYYDRDGVELPPPAAAEAAPPKNAAFVFIKPHAVTPATEKLVRDGLEAKGITVIDSGTISGTEIDEKKLIDQHYYAIASKATILKPAELNVPEDKFEAQFGLPWKEALASGRAVNAMDGCAALGLTADEMDAEWAKCKKAKRLIKFGGGFYCGLIEVEGKEPLYVFNGFFMSMRSKFTAPGCEIKWYTVEFDAETLPWADFRGEVLGPTDPAEAPAGSLRGQIYADWESLGLTAKPNVGDNGVHASASPFEGLAERANWVGASVAADPFGKALIEAGVPEATIVEWSVDPQVPIGDGKRGSLFDQLEDLDADKCIARAKELVA